MQPEDYIRRTAAAVRLVRSWVTDEKPTFWGYVKAFFTRVGQLCLRYPLAAALTVLIVVGAVLLAAFGSKLQIGGLIGKLWGRKDSGSPDDPVLHPPPGRVDPTTGKPIEPGQPDPNGFAQPVPVKIKEPGIFSDPGKVTVVEPSGKEVEVKLPTGVKNEDVKQVVQIAPNVYQVRNNDTGTDAGKLLEDISK